MEQSTDSTKSDSEAPDAEDRQRMIYFSVDELMLRIVEHPYDSALQLFQYVTLGGPCLTQEDVLPLSGGRLVFRRTCRRINLIRRAARRGEMHTIPVDLRRWVELARPEMDPPYRDYVDWRRPHQDSEQMFWRDVPGTEEELARFPAQQDAVEFYGLSEDGSRPSDADGDTEDDDWSRPPPINTMGAEWFYE